MSKHTEPKSVYIDTDCHCNKLIFPDNPRQVTSAMRAAACGSRTNLPDGNVLRAFLYWKGNDGPDLWNGIDLDLSVVFYGEEKAKFIYYANPKDETLGAVHSGDRRCSGKNGAVEYVDFDIKKCFQNGFRYAALTVKSYSGEKFSEMENAFCGVMVRDGKTGEQFEPATVKDRFALTTDSDQLVMVVIDLMTREVITVDKSVAQFRLSCRNVVTDYAKQTKETQNLNVQLVEMRQEAETEEDNTDWSKGMLDINSDYKGWLTIYGTQISEPVVQGETNETYLRTNINKEHAEAGTLFLDETTDLSQDGNLIIYGHKMNDGTMFGTLDKFEDEEFFDNNGTVCWESEKGKEYYQIFALLVLPGYSTAPDFIDLQAWNNVLDEEQTADMLNTIADRASIFRGESFNLEKDKYLFLVTCDYSINNGRLVLVGRRLSKKSKTEDTTEENTDNTEEAVSEEENSENVE